MPGVWLGLLMMTLVMAGVGIGHLMMVVDAGCLFRDDYGASG